MITRMENKFCGSFELNIKIIRLNVIHFLHTYLLFGCIICPFRTKYFSSYKMRCKHSRSCCDVLTPKWQTMVTPCGLFFNKNKYFVFYEKIYRKKLRFYINKPSITLCVSLCGQHCKGILLFRLVSLEIRMFC